MGRCRRDAALKGYTGPSASSPGTCCVTGFFERLKQRKLVQWVLAYAAGAWALLQVLEMATGSYPKQSVTLSMQPAVV